MGPSKLLLHATTLFHVTPQKACHFLHLCQYVPADKKNLEIDYQNYIKVIERIGFAIFFCSTKEQSTTSALMNVQNDNVKFLAEQKNAASWLPQTLFCLSTHTRVCVCVCVCERESVGGDCSSEQKKNMFVNEACSCQSVSFSFFTSRSLIAQYNNACWQSSRAVVVVVVVAAVVVACCCANLLLCVMPRLRVADQFTKVIRLVLVTRIVKK